MADPAVGLNDYINAMAQGVPFVLHVSDANGAFVLNQKSTGNIMDLQDSGTSVFKLADGGALTLAGAVTMNSTLTVAGAMDFNNALDIDLTTGTTGQSVINAQWNATGDSAVATGYGLYTKAAVSSANGTLTDYVGLFMSNNTAGGTITNSYALGFDASSDYVSSSAGTGSSTYLNVLIGTAKYTIEAKAV